MYVRLGAAGGGRGLRSSRRPRFRGTFTLWFVVVHACAVTGACRRPAAADTITVEWSLAPTPPVVGGSTLTLRVLDAARRPVRGAALKVEGHMSHPGMSPVLASVAERGDGLYEAELQFTMRGDWILLVSGSLSSGAAVRHRIDVPNVQPR